MRIAIFTNPTRDNTEIKKHVESIAISLGFVLDDVNPEVVFACGGDGTLLRSVHAYIDKLDSVSFFGVNYGNMGFFYDYDKSEVEQALIDLKNNELISSKHHLLKGLLFKNNKKIDEFDAVNEIRVENNYKPLNCDVYINNSLFESYSGTGLTIGSSIGSTAYNLTLSGSAVLNDLESLQLTLVQPSLHFKGFRPSIVMSRKHSVKLDLSSYGHEVLLGYDFVIKEHCLFDQIEISSSEKQFVLLNKKGFVPQRKLVKLFD